MVFVLNKLLLVRLFGNRLHWCAWRKMKDDGSVVRSFHHPGFDVLVKTSSKPALPDQVLMPEDSFMSRQLHN